VTRAYRLDAYSRDIADALSADQGPDPWGGGDPRPGTFAPVIVRSSKTTRRFIRPMVWGYPAPNSLTPAGDVQWVTSVRNVASPFWIGNLRHIELRCLVPATSIGSQIPTMSESAPAAIFAMAGIWRDLTDMPVFAIITVDNESDVAKKRSTPLILDSAQQQMWLTADWKEASRLVVPAQKEPTTCA
jgi:putative SOS response-associated peptidase YedK